jgi:NADPH:quinone reductase-like Zn-dependent oxidoreductase
MARAIEQRVWPLFAAGKLKAVIDSSFKLEDSVGAHRRIDDPEHIGKIMLVTAAGANQAIA